MQGNVETIKPYVDDFIEFAKAYPELSFFVTRIGCGIAGFNDEQIAPLFDGAYNLKNVILPMKFRNIISHTHQLASETAGMVFHTIPIKFFDEDLKKAESMRHDEKMEFFRYLRQNKRYVTQHDSPTMGKV